MATNIKLIRSIEYLTTSPEGVINFEKSKQILTDLAKAKQPPADYDIILDFRHTQVKLSITDIWYLAVELSKYEHTYKDKVAILILPGLNFEKATFFELCSENRGFNVKVFTDYEDAIHWFFENDD